MDDKLRLEYDPLEEVLYAPRMPTANHESFSEQVSQETKAQLDRIASGSDEAARSYESSTRTTTSKLTNPTSNDSQMSSFNIRRELGKTAWTYIPYSNGNIKAVVEFELRYGKSKEGRISLWQPLYLKEGEDCVETLDVEAVIDRDIRTESVH